MGQKKSATQFARHRGIPEADAQGSLRRKWGLSSFLRTTLCEWATKRSHQVYRLKGHTPAQALREALGIDTIPNIVPPEEVLEPLPTAA
jgi:hypothetical protein